MSDLKNKSFVIPAIPDLDRTPLSDVAPLLRDHGSRLSIDTLNWPDAYPYAPITVVTAAHSDTTLYLDFDVRCNYLRAVNTEDNSPVHQDSCVEFFVAPVPGTRSPYINFEFNCIGTLSAAMRRGRSEDVRPLTAEQLATVRRHSSCGTRPFNEIEGLFTWNLTVAIPLELLGLTAADLPVTLYGNFYKCADLTASPHFLSWGGIDTPQPDFHRPEFFLPIELA